MMLSWIIIGKNWNEHFNQLTNAIDCQTADQNKYEIIIVDDGSVDHSIDKLETYCLKNNFVLIKNKVTLGRGAARNRGVRIAKNDWCLFSNNNTYPEPNLIKDYLEKINNNVDIIVGSVKYSCPNDMKFEKYLNAKNRGINKYNESDEIPFQFVLFGNCAMQKTIITQTKGFNEKILKYGGEELELMWRITNENLNIKIIKNNAYVTRINHPSFIEHCDRMVDFGINLNKNLPFELNQLIIPNLLNKFKYIIPTCLGLKIIKIVYKTMPALQLKMIKLGLGMAVLKGTKK
jgi:glycosyltransferase involved in cell wall biosynthesis